MVLARGENESRRAVLNWDSAPAGIVRFCKISCKLIVLCYSQLTLRLTLAGAWKRSHRILLVTKIFYTTSIFNASFCYFQPL